MKKTFLYLAAAASLNAVVLTPLQAEGVGEQKGALVVNRAGNLGLARQLVTILFPNAGQDAMDGLKMGVLSELDMVEDSAFRNELEQEVGLALKAATPIMNRHMASVTDAYTQAFAREYSADELTQILAFAQTRVGAHFLPQNGALDNDSAVLEAQAKMMEDVLPIFDAVSKMMCKHKAELRVAQGETDAKCSMA